MKKLSSWIVLREGMRSMWFLPVLLAHLFLKESHNNSILSIVQSLKRQAHRLQSLGDLQEDTSMSDYRVSAAYCTT